MPRKTLAALKSPRSTEISPLHYRAMLTDIKARIRTAQVKASLAVNRELIQLYWDIGGLIVRRQRKEGWGNSVVERLARDIQNSFSGIEGFSPQNIWKMRGFFLAWTQDITGLPRLARANRSDAFLSQAVREMDGHRPPRAVAEIPWGHNTVLIFKLKDPLQRLWYAQQTTAAGWSRAMLEHWIASGLHARRGRAVTHFKQALPALQSDLANELARDPYHFDFLTLNDQVAERDLEKGLLAHIRRFLIELGAVDDLLRHPADQPSIGLILCKTRNKAIAEYALRGLRTPMSIARYTTKLAESLPSRKQLEVELEASSC